MSKSGKTITTKGSPPRAHHAKTYRQSKQKLQKLRQTLREKERLAELARQREKQKKAFKRFLMVSSIMTAVASIYYFIL